MTSASWTILPYAGTINGTPCLLWSAISTKSCKSGEIILLMVAIWTASLMYTVGTESAEQRSAPAASKAWSATAWLTILLRGHQQKTSLLTFKARLKSAMPACLLQSSVNSWLVRIQERHLMRTTWSFAHENHIQSGSWPPFIGWQTRSCGTVRFMLCNSSRTCIFMLNDDPVLSVIQGAFRTSVWCCTVEVSSSLFTDMFHLGVQLCWLFEHGAPVVNHVKLQ